MNVSGARVCAARSCYGSLAQSRKWGCKTVRRQTPLKSAFMTKQNSIKSYGNQQVCFRARNVMSVSVKVSMGVEAGSVNSETNSAPGSETKQAKLDRRKRESNEVDMRVENVSSCAQLSEELSSAKDQLIVLELESDTLCELKDVESVSPAYFDQPEEILFEPCSNLKHSFQRIARNCPDVKFLSFTADASEESIAYCKETLGVDMFPTLQFYKNGRLLWQHEGVDDALRDLDEGVLFYRDEAQINGNNVTEIRSKKTFHDTIAQANEANELLVLDVSSSSASPCLHIFPAVVSLARAFKGHVSFARIVQDRNVETAELVSKDLIVDEVPTFIFYFNGQERHRFSSSSRGDLIGQLLEQQEKLGYKLPPPTKKKQR